jgi:mRNA interferase MazF
LKRGDVALVVLQGETGKPRPGVIVQADELDDLPSIIVCPMSSDILQTSDTRPIVTPTPENGLRVATQIMTDKMNAIKRDRVRRVIGALDATTCQALDSVLLVVLGLSRRAIR